LDEPITDQENAIAREEELEFEGEVLEALGDGMLRVELENGHTLIPYTAGKMRRYRIRMVPSDRISVQVSSYDPNRGRTTYGHR
jgi:translation initiation factor IF-1